MDEKWVEILERRRAERSSLQAEVLQKVLELVVRERISQSEKAKSTEEKTKLNDGPPRNFSRIIRRIHLFLHLMQLRSELLYCLVIFS